MEQGDEGQIRQVTNLQEYCLKWLEQVITGFTGIDINIKTYTGNLISHDQQQTQGSLVAEIIGRILCYTTEGQQSK